MSDLKRILYNKKIIYESEYDIRIFTPDGVELFEEDLFYINNGECVIISKGEDFNQDSMFG